jgi:hypothetical protein
MKFRTEINVERAPFDLSYADALFFIGSCFSSSIGDRLSRLKFPVMINPTGVLYNPASICGLLGRFQTKEHFQPSDTFCQDGVWNSFSLHGCFSATSQEALLDSANRAVDEAHDFLEKTSCLFITLGTAWIYRLRQSGAVVANCHKVPSAQFERERLSVDEVVELFIPVIQTMVDAHPRMRVIFTVSPIRHWKDGAHGNQLSKATLLLAVDHLCSLFPDSVSYFPSYELLMDDLRDYRFYADDLLHPSQAAVDFIFSHLQQTYMSTDTQRLCDSVGALVAAASHRPFNPSSFDYKRFCSSNLHLIDELQRKIPNVDFSVEKKLFNYCGGGLNDGKSAAT